MDQSTKASNKYTLKQEVIYYGAIGAAALIFTASVLLLGHGLALLLGTTL